MRLSPVLVSVVAGVSALLSFVAPAAATAAAPTPSVTRPATKPAAAPIAHSPSGTVDSATATATTVTMSGWALDRDRLTSPEQIDIWQSSPTSHFLGRTTTTLLRADVNRALKVTGTHGWTATFTAPVGTDTICAYAINVGPGYNAALGCKRLVVTPVSSTAPIGNWESLAATGLSVALSGWAVDRDVPAGAQAVRVYEDGQPQVLLASTTTNTARADVNAGLHVTGLHGWRAELTVAAGRHSFCVTLQNLGPARPDTALACRELTVTPSGTGALEGAVQDQSGQPLAGVRVVATATGDGTQTSDVSQVGDGTFVVAGLTPGEYTLCFEGERLTQPSALGYFDQCITEGTQTLQIPLGADQVNTGYSVRMVPVATVSGTVRDAAGHPLTGVTVRHWDSQPGVITSADGSYSFRLPAGEYAICFDGTAVTGPSAPVGYLSSCSDAFSIEGGQALTDQDRVLIAAGAISGRVIDIEGHPLHNVQVSFVDHGNLSASTAVDGSYRLSPVDPSKAYQLKFTPDATIEGGTSSTGYLTATSSAFDVVAGKITTGVDAQIHPGGAISGRVTDVDGNPIQGVEVSLGWDISTRSAADGTYRVDTLTAVDWHVCFSLRAPYGQDGWVAECYLHSDEYGATNVAVTEGATTTGIDMMLTRQGRISGRVTDEAGRPVPGAYVGVRGNGWLGSRPTELIGQGTTDDNGVYDLTGVNPGTYDLCVTPLSDAAGDAERCFEDITEESSTEPIEVKPGTTTSGIDVVLLRQGSISGRVTNAAGEPIVGLLVTARGYLGTESAYTDADGNYRITRVVPGKYSVCFDHSVYGSGRSSTGLVDQCYNGREDGSATDVPVGSGENVTGINAVMQPAASISGTVTDTSGHPIRNVLVEVSDGGYAYTDSAGHYLAIGIHPRTLTVCFDGQFAVGAGRTGFERLCYNGVPVGGAGTPVTVVAHRNTPNINEQLAPEDNPQAARAG